MSLNSRKMGGYSGVCMYRIQGKSTVWRGKQRGKHNNKGEVNGDSWIFPSVVPSVFSESTTIKLSYTTQVREIWGTTWESFSRLCGNVSRMYCFLESRRQCIRKWCHRECIIYMGIIITPKDMSRYRSLCIFLSSRVATCMSTENTNYVVLCLLQYINNVVACVYSFLHESWLMCVSAFVWFRGYLYMLGWLERNCKMKWMCTLL